MTEITHDSTVRDAIEHVIESAENGGGKCPVCQQHTQAYKRHINSGMARALIKFYQAVGTGWGHLATHDKSREASKLAYWGLLEEEPEARPDGGRSGWWRITTAGEQFVLGNLEVPKFARVYNGDLLSLDDSDGNTNIRQALGHKFDYSELMNS